MKKLRFLTGRGDGRATVPNGQLLSVSMVPGTTTGSYLQINESAPIWVPVGTTIDLTADELGLCCGEDECNRYPGDVQIVIVFGTIVQISPRALTGDEPLSWLVVYNGC